MNGHPVGIGQVLLIGRWTAAYHVSSGPTSLYITVTIMQQILFVLLSVLVVFEVRFLADLVNTRVIPPLSIITLFNNFIEVIHESHIPQVCAL